MDSKITMRSPDKKDYTPASTHAQMEDFIKYSPIWKDFKIELSIWLNEVHEMMENNEGTLTSRALDRLGGSAEAIRNFEDLPFVIMTNIESKVKVKKKSSV